MKVFIAIPVLFAASALAAPDWSYTFTFSNAESTWTSYTYATGAPNATTTGPASSTWTGPEEFVSTTSYTAEFSSGTSTWGVPTVVSYSVGETWTSMIPAATGSTSAAVSSAASATTETAVAAGTTLAASTTSAAATSFTGAAAPNVNGKLAGVGAIAVAGLALVL
ncbi:hypothetical protein A1O1_04195 [Capronia coronata CBS 617.96]|uniref:Uncharacterized protein n=1 Tax=Capronia coronata CBS 617.96 TaxID=1182541 RepID=W9YEW4_9EURO|nr:uncharacterized protein A1O1_04195 [Capronia coronata CBS 617.96]EXJ91088.1 hypothetical protein A1O1_04195 [Capronia coronata CBS 617.96]